MMPIRLLLQKGWSNSQTSLSATAAPAITQMRITHALRAHMYTVCHAATTMVQHYRMNVSTLLNAIVLHTRGTLITVEDTTTILLLKTS